MREILATYDISNEMLHFIPTQKLYSSYIGDMWFCPEGEDPDEKLAAYSAMIRREVLYGIDLNTVSIVYTYPIFSSCVDPYDLPWASLRNIAFNGQNSTVKLGTISEITLDESNFDQMIGPRPHYDELSQTIRQNNVAAYKVIPYSDYAPKMFSFYYVLRQNDGSVLVACCCTDSEGEFNLIREIFKG